MLKPVHIKDKLETFSVKDSAIDLDAMSQDEQVELGTILTFKPTEAWKYVKWKAGEEPTKFTLRTLDPDEISRILDQTERVDQETKKPVVDQRTRNFRFFLDSLVEIDGWDVPMSGDGKPSKDWIKKTFIGELYSVALELGGRAFAWNTVTEQERKNYYGRLRPKKTSVAQTVESAAIFSEPEEGAESQATT